MLKELNPLLKESKSDGDFLRKLYHIVPVSTDDSDTIQEYLRLHPDVEIKTFEDIEEDVLDNIEENEMNIKERNIENEEEENSDEMIVQHVAHFSDSGEEYERENNSEKAITIEEEEDINEFLALEKTLQNEN